MPSHHTHFFESFHSPGEFDNLQSTIGFQDLLAIGGVVVFFHSLYLRGLIQPALRSPAGTAGLLLLPSHSSPLFCHSALLVHASSSLVLFSSPSPLYPCVRDSRLLASSPFSAIFLSRGPLCFFLLDPR